MIEQDVITGVRFMGAASMIAVAVALACVNRGQVRSNVYEHARWLVCAASLLLGIHNLIQFFGHFREQSVTLCWTINLAFYTAITPLYNMGELYLLRAGRGMAGRMWNAVIFWIVCYTILGIGYATDTLINDDAPWRTATFVVAVCYFLKIAEISYILRRDMRVAYARLTDEELSERHQALRYTAHSIRWVIWISFVTPWMGMSASLTFNSVLGLVCYLLLLWFAIQFALYGKNITEVIEVNDELVEAEMIEAESTQVDHTTAAAPSGIHSDVQARIELWVASRHYTDPNITIRDALNQMAVSATALNYYLERHTHVRGYRRWLPYLRIEESKRIMLEHPEYSLQAVAEACGYASKSSLSHAFKAQEGMPPAEWLSLQMQKAEHEA